jgi:DNA polymerase elongation subunit (family B)
VLLFVGGFLARGKITQPGYSAAWYDLSKGEICLKYFESDSNEPEVERFKFDWYLYLNKQDFEDVNCRELDSKIDKVELCDGDTHVRVYAPARTREQRDKLTEWFRKRGIEPLEGDVDPLTRWMSDNPIKFAEPRILFYDLETDSRKGFITTEGGERIPNPDSQILSIAWGNADGEFDVEVADALTPQAESRVLETFFDVVAGYDLLVAWNGKAFDERVLKGRAKRLGFHPAWDTINFLDLMLLFQHPYFGFVKDSESVGVKTMLSLSKVSQALLGYGKFEGITGAEVYKIWCKDKGRVAEYNVQDVRQMVDLEKVKRYIAGFVVMCHTCNRFVSSMALHAGYANDGFVLRYGAEHGVRLPTKKPVDESKEHERLKGAFVFDPKPGLHEGVCFVDFSALYPSIIRTFNVSPETRVSEKFTGAVAVAENGARFRTDVDGVVPSVVAICTTNRAKFKAEMKRLEKEGKEDSEDYQQAKSRSNSWKVVQNSLYGLLGSRYSRIYDPACAEAVTLTGQLIIKSVNTWAETEGMSVLAGDTDSAALHGTEDNVRAFIGVVATKTDALVEERGGRPGYIRLDMDAQYKRIFWAAKSDGESAKKHYAGVKTSGKIEIKGLEMIRGDGCKYRRDFQREVVQYVLMSEKPTVDEAEKIARRWCARLFSMDVPVDDLAITVGLSSSPDKYEVDLPQVRVAKEMIRKGKEVFVGMKIPYIVVGVLKDAGKERLQAIHVDDYAGMYDAKHYWKKSVYPGVKRVLMAVFPVEADRWKRLEKYDPSDGQGTMFEEKKVARAERLVLRLVGEDASKLERLRELAVAEYDGPKGAALPLCLEMDGGLVDTKVMIRWARPFVREVEKLMGHRVYYGNDNELGG